MKITIEMLDKKQACYDGMIWFMRYFGTEAGHTDIIRQLEKEKTTTDWMDWLYHTFQLSGRFRRWYPGGRLNEEYMCQNGKPHGRHRLWDPDGTLRIDYIYRKGKLHGRYRQWGSDGTLWVDFIYRNDKLIKDNKEEKNENNN